jgi:hypothetical protein
LRLMEIREIFGKVWGETKRVRGVLAGQVCS